MATCYGLLAVHGRGSVAVLFISMALWRWVREGVESARIMTLEVGDGDGKESRVF